MADYCELCDLPLSTCVHGMPPPPPPVPKPASRPAPRRTSSSRPASSRPASARASHSPAPPTPTPPRRLTTAEAIRPHIVAVLEDAGGTLDADEVYERLEARIGDDFLERDLTTTPEGELRWRLATRKARQSLISEGVMVAGPGEWRLDR